MQCASATNYRIVQTRISVGELTKQHMWWSFSGGKTATSIDFLGVPTLANLSLFFSDSKRQEAVFLVLGRITKTPIAGRYHGLICEINKRV